MARVVDRLKFNLTDFNVLHFGSRPDGARPIKQVLAVEIPCLRRADASGSDDLLGTSVLKHPPAIRTHPQLPTMLELRFLGSSVAFPRLKRLSQWFAGAL